jgi:predicted nucleic acid-binding protein
MPTLLVDTNVILDVILKRAPWAEEGVLILDAVARGAARGFVAGHAVTTVHCIVEREVGLAAANTAVSDLLQLLTVVALDGADFQRALALGLKDYEDAVQVAAYLKIGAHYLVTRNARDYRGAPVTVQSSGEVLAVIRAGQK